MPTGEIVAEPACRGTLMGNRGILHDADRKLGAARWRHKAWVCCLLTFRNRHRTVMQPGAYTELFFLDEAVAMAAGHRPCAECRRHDYTRFGQAWTEAMGHHARAPEIDRALHPARVTRARTQVRHMAQIADLPDGAFIWAAGRACLVHGDALRPFSPAGYAAPLPRPRSGTVTVCTPAPLVEVLRAGYPVRFAA